MHPTRYPSKIDLWLALVLLGTAALVLAAVILTPKLDPLSLGFTLIVGAGLPLWLLWGTYYDIDATTLHVHSAFMHWRVPLQAIRQVQPTRSLMSAPALSLDRLQVDYKRFDCILISPRNRADFLAVLKARVPAGVKGL